MFFVEDTSLSESTFNRFEDLKLLIEAQLKEYNGQQFEKLDVRINEIYSYIIFTI